MELFYRIFVLQNWITLSAVILFSITLQKHWEKYLQINFLQQSAHNKNLLIIFWMWVKINNASFKTMVMQFLVLSFVPIYIFFLIFRTSMRTIWVNAAKLSQLLELSSFWAWDVMLYTENYLCGMCRHFQYSVIYE